MTIKPKTAPTTDGGYTAPGPRFESLATPRRDDGHTPAGAVGKPITFKLLGVVHRFAPGHSVRLVLAAADQSSYNSPAPDQITVTTGSGSTFSLPVDSSRGLF